MAGGDGSVAMIPHVLIVAGSDSSGGAGIVRDVETVSAFGLYCSVVITAVTVQTHTRVERIEQMPPDLVAEQMCAAFTVNPVEAIKIGMLGTVATIDAVASVLANYLPVPVVLDPVLVSTSGHHLLDKDAIDILKRRLLPLSRVVTPNLPELALLTGQAAASSGQEIVRQTQILLAAGGQAVLVKGGHAEGDRSTDLLVTADGTHRAFDAPCLVGTMRGTGCMLASAVATHLALGERLEISITKAKRHVFTKMAIRLAT